jgi:hypothetical protein
MDSDGGAIFNSAANLRYGQPPGQIEKLADCLRDRRHLGRAPHIWRSFDAPNVANHEPHASE